jgi:hypothetical protein
MYLPALDRFGDVPHRLLGSTWCDFPEERLIGLPEQGPILEVVAEKRKLGFDVHPIVRSEIHKARFTHVDFESDFQEPLLQRVKQSLALAVALAVEDEIVGVPREWGRWVLTLHPHVDGEVKKEVRQ